MVSFVAMDAACAVELAVAAALAAVVFAVDPAGAAAGCSEQPTRTAMQQAAMPRTVTDFRLPTISNPLCFVT